MCSAFLMCTGALSASAQTAPAAADDFSALSGVRTVQTRCNCSRQAARVIGTVVGNESRLRLSVSVFNTHDDIDRVVDVLGGRARSSVARG